MHPNSTLLVSIPNGQRATSDVIENEKRTSMNPACRDRLRVMSTANTASTMVADAANISIICVETPK